MLPVKLSIVSFITLIAVTLSNHSLPVLIHGKLKYKTGGSLANNVLIYATGAGKVLDKTFTDTKGKFELNFDPGDIKTVSIYGQQSGKKAVLLRSISKFESDEITILLTVPN